MQERRRMHLGAVRRVAAVEDPVAVHGGAVAVLREEAIQHLSGAVVREPSLRDLGVEI